MKIRSLLLVPGDKPESMVAALGSGADALVLDLEDSVASENKRAARQHVAEFLRRPQRPMPVFVRINPIATARSADDLAAIRSVSTDGIVLPKAEGAISVIDLQRALGGKPTRILPVATETPTAVFQLGSYAQVACRLMGIAWGTESLSTLVGASAAHTSEGALAPPYEMLRGLTLFAAHSSGVAAIDAVYSDVRNAAGLAAYVARAARDGFTGMFAVDPSQVAVINAGFTPSAEAIKGAERVVAAFHENRAGLVDLDGRMLCSSHLKQAMNLLARGPSAATESRADL